ncbi:hypothetical protein MASR2M8_17130 [Opitutaceae bacterium]
MGPRTINQAVVAVSARYVGYCHSVLGNEPQALGEIVNHLYSLGHRRIGWLGGNANLGRHEARFTAFKVALEQKGLKIDPRHTIVLKEGDRAEGVEAMHAMLPYARRRDSSLHLRHLQRTDGQRRRACAAARGLERPPTA